MTQKQREMLDSYERADNSGELYQVYGRFSSAKREALDYCKSVRAQLDGYDPRIPSANSFIFTYAFRYIDEDGDEALAYITPNYDRFFKIA